MHSLLDSQTCTQVFMVPIHTAASPVDHPVIRVGEAGDQRTRWPVGALPRRHAVMQRMHRHPTPVPLVERVQRRTSTIGCRVSPPREACGGAAAAVTADRRPRSPGVPVPPPRPYIARLPAQALSETFAVNCWRVGLPMRSMGRMLLRRAVTVRPSVSVTNVARLSSFTPARSVLAAHPTSRLTGALQPPHAVRGFAASAAGARLSHPQPQPSGKPRASRPTID
jgi:hypothetical protein